MTTIRCNTRRQADPFADLFGFYTDIDRYVSGDRPAPSAEAGKEWRPAIDIHDADGEFVLRADLPGLAKKDVSLTIDGTVLSLRGERAYQEVDDSERLARRERSHGQFHRSFDLATEVNAGEVKAVFADGVLTVTIPKVVEETPKEVEIPIN